MATFKFELVSPERLLLSEDVEQVVVPGDEGDFGVLPGHAPMVATLRPGIIEVTKPGGGRERMFVRGGFAEVDPASLTILAQQAINIAELKGGELAREIKASEESLSSAKDDAARRHAQEALDSLRTLEGARS